LITLEVFGDPAPQGSKKVVRGRLIEASKKLKPWRAAIEKACQPYAQDNIYLGPVRLEVDFFLPRPPSIKMTKRPLPIVPPDLDKLLRAVGDGIGQSGFIWGDDSQVVEIFARKFYADDREPGAVINITFL
jgi:Holliday junction resolvase RusA-like endonuclease